MTLSNHVSDAKLSVELNTSVPPLAEIRRWLAAVLVEFAEDVLQDLMLISTELVTNAYEHADMPRRLRVRRSRDRHTVRIEVEDGSPGRMPVVGTSSLGEFRGRGLIMVAALSQRWGTHRTSDGKTVWAQLTLA